MGSARVSTVRRGSVLSGVRRISSALGNDGTVSVLVERLDSIESPRVLQNTSLVADLSARIDFEWPSLYIPLFSEHDRV
jgi:hypothetical protein